MAEEIDCEAVVAFLRNKAYWGTHRDADMIHEQLAGAWRVVACIDSHGATVGFARALSDGVALAYLADVFVLEGHRGRGLGKAILRLMIEGGPGSNFRWMLHTRDAHALYAEFGFVTPDITAMERPHRPTYTGAEATDRDSPASSGASAALAQ